MVKIPSHIDAIVGLEMNMGTSRDVEAICIYYYYYLKIEKRKKLTWHHQFHFL